MTTLAATTISLEPEWAAVLLIGLPIMFRSTGLLHQGNGQSAIDDLERRIDAKLDKVARDARKDTQAVWRNQVEWMDHAHTVDSDKIRRPPDDY